MLTLHTLTNVYDEGGDYHQFAQRDHQHLLDSTGLAYRGTLREFLDSNVIGECEAPDERQQNLLAAVLETGDVTKLLGYAERCCMREHPAVEHVCMTRFGEWEFDSLVLVEPTLRELQEDIWASDPDFPKEDWEYEVENGDTHQGYWEWIEHKRGIPDEEPVIESGPRPSDDCPSHDEPIVPGMRVRWHDPDAGACSRDGILAQVEHRGGDDMLRITLEDGWSCECLRHEIEILSDPDEEET